MVHFISVILHKRKPSRWRLLEPAVYLTPICLFSGMILHNVLITHTHTHTRVFNWTNVMKLWALMWPLSVFCYATVIGLRSNICSTDTERGTETGWLIDVYTKKMLIKTNKNAGNIKSKRLTALPKKSSCLQMTQPCLVSSRIMTNLHTDRKCPIQQKMVGMLMDLGKFLLCCNSMFYLIAATLRWLIDSTHLLLVRFSWLASSKFLFVHWCIKGVFKSVLA